MEERKWHPTEALPSNLSHYTPSIRSDIAGDFYVSAAGSENAGGTISDPFPSLEKALEAARKLHISEPERKVAISLLDGVYDIKKSIVLTEKDSNTIITARNDGKVLFTGGIKFRSSDFEPVTDNLKFNFPEEALGRIYSLDMKKYGLTENEWSRIYAAGGALHQGDSRLWNGKQCEIFLNKKRLSLPVYPREGFINIGKIVDGKVKTKRANASTPGIIITENSSGNENYQGFGGTFEIDRDTLNVIRSWRSFSDIWAKGYFAVDWSSSVLPIEMIDLNNGTVTTALNDAWGLAEGGYFTFYNVPEAMTDPGLYYIDYQNGILYIYPDCDIRDAEVEMSILNEPFIRIENAHDVLIDGINFSLSKSNAIFAKGDRITVNKCEFTNIFETAVVIEGIRNTIKECVFAHLAKSGADMIAGDKPSLTPGYAVFDNNLVHDYGEVDKSGVHAVSIVGVHNRISHNEIYNSPYTVIHYSGQDHLIEYNYAHDIVQNTGDMGTTYSGFHWDSQGCVLRYNCFCNIGNEKFGSNGIYWDDMLGGQTGYGNIIINAGGHGFIIGGGRDHLNYNNIVLNCGGYPILYDQRGCEWEKDFGANTNSGIWNNLKSVPYKSEKWANKFPALARVTEEPDYDNPNFPPVPANSRVTGNVYISILKPLVMEKVRQFSIFGNNVELDITDNPGFVDREGGNYNFREDSVIFDQLPAFENLPFEKMGRY